MKLFLCVSGVILGFSQAFMISSGWALGLSAPSIHREVWNQNESELKHLLKSPKVIQYSLNATNSYYFNMTPLALAVIRNDLNTVQTLLAAGAKIDAADSKNFTPLHLAVETKNFEILEELLKFLPKSPQLAKVAFERELADHRHPPVGINPIEAQRSLFIFAEMYGEPLDSLELTLARSYVEMQKEILNFFHRNSDPTVSVQSPIKRFGTALHLAAAKCDLKSTKLLVNAGAPIESKRSGDRATPLQVALYAGCLPVVEELYLRGAKLAYDYKHLPLIFFPAQEGRSEYIERIKQALTESNQELAEALLTAYGHSKNQPANLGDIPLSHFNERLNLFAKALTPEDRNNVVKDLFETQEESCSICLDNLRTTPLSVGNGVVLLPCGHYFHHECLSHWSGSCPNCRREFSLRKLYRVHRESSEPESERQTEIGIMAPVLLLNSDMAQPPSIEEVP